MPKTLAAVGKTHYRRSSDANCPGSLYGMARAGDLPRTNGRNGNLRIPLPFEDALKAATEVKPPEKAPRKPRSKKPAKP